MDYVFDLYRMKVVSAINNDKKTHWKQFLLLALLANHAKLQEKLLAFIASLLSLESYIKLLRSKLLREKRPKGLIRLPYYSTQVKRCNDILVAILKDYKFQLGDLTIHDSGYSTANEEKQVTIDKDQDIHFKLQFAQIKGDPKAEPSVMESNNIKDLYHSCGVIFSYTKTSQEIYDYLENRYFKKKVVTTAMLKTIFVLRITKLRKRMYGTWERQLISKDFDNIFLEPSVRERLMQQLKRFENCQWFIDRGIPRTMGILLHGAPGCGKTSIIKAIANHFNRKILLVDFKLVKTWQQLRLIFSQIMIHEDGESNGDRTCYHDETVYVFEDFDCMTKAFIARNSNDDAIEYEKEKQERQRMKKTLNQYRKRYRKKLLEDMKKRPDATEEKEFDTLKSLLDNLQKDNGTKNQKEDAVGRKEKWRYDDEDFSDWDTEEDEGNQVTLSNFLEILDGIVEMHGRIIIMTTNMRDKIDSALVRPGRIDLDIELLPPSRHVIQQIFFHMYKGHDEEMLRRLWVEHEALIPENGGLCTAQVMNACMFLDPVKGLEDLTSSCSKLANT